ncbi:endonuclease domain-containing protein [Mycobacterium sp. 155]|uniref:endonuclease domain-containing protein n=1 Tax=Mycobacterium sp. 155 TaxID=1157943 RepID=UPI000362F028|nr:DUF559 domain-containing protein [Mycobacterium sp. 155]
MRLAGPTAEELAVALDPLPAGAPVVIHCRLRPGAARVVVDSLLDHLETVACQLFPSWLPDADMLHTSDLDCRVVRALARRHAAASEHFGPFLADLAEAALLGRPMRERHDPELQARGLRRALCAAYGTDDVAVLIDASADEDVDEASCATALKWLTTHGGFGVWLLAGAMASVDRFPTVTLPGGCRPVTADADDRVEFPPLLGLPHPASAAEQALEKALARCGWAAERTWNQVYQPHSLARPIRVDLLWPQARCVVEIDGPDHRGALKYAADRWRDNTLVLDGFTVLRFTNDEVAADVSRVVGMIERMLAVRRAEGNTQ